MTNEKGQTNYRKLLYYFHNEVMVHFKDLDGIFYNGMILSIDEKYLTIVLRERVRGDIPFILENIDTDSISAYKIREGED